MEINKAIKFYNQCFQLDNRELALWDVTDKKHDFKIICDEQTYKRLKSEFALDLDSAQGEDLYARTIYYRREKHLIACFGLVYGKLDETSSFGKSKSIHSRAPLLMYDAEIVESQPYFIGSKWGSPQWNIPLIKKLLGDNYNYSKISRLLRQTKPLDQDLLQTIVKYLNDNSDHYTIGFDEEYKDEDRISSLKKSRNSKISIAPHVSYVFVDRSRSTRGVIDELSVLEEVEDFSTPINLLFGNAEYMSRYSWKTAIRVPGVLSNAQEQIIKNARTEPLGLVIGPPGTGKSYTIAAMALDYFLNGKSVLIVSRNEYAVGVVQDKLINTFGVAAQAIMRSGEHEQHKNLTRYFKDIIKYDGVNIKNEGFSNKSHIRDSDEFNELAKDFEHWSEKSLRYGKLLHESKTSRIGALEKFKLWWFKFKSSKSTSSFKKMERLNQLSDKRNHYLSSLINTAYYSSLKTILASDRKSIVGFKNAIVARSSNRQEQMFDNVDFDILLSALPIWLCSLDNLHKALPLSKEMFDLVLFDEATQCDIATCIPALYRAKKAVVVGDPMQLRHISFLSQTVQDEIKKALGPDELGVMSLSYRDHSVLDLFEENVGKQNRVIMLDEHYRSLPEIIEFSNRKIYGNKLRVMREKPKVVSKSPIKIVECSGNRVNGINKEEGESIIQEIRELISEQKSLPESEKLSIGVLSFFRDQAEYLQELIMKHFTIHDILVYKLRAGTPYSFQGEERNVMLISCCIDDEVNTGTYTYLDRLNVFNVAVTRAKDYQVLFLSVSPDKIAPKHLLKQYIDHAREFYKEIVKSDQESRDFYINQLCDTLTDIGLEYYQGVSIAKNLIDLYCYKGSFSFGIDLIGFPGQYEEAITIDRYKVLKRTGLHIVPLTMHEWVYRKDEFIYHIKALLDKNKDKVDILEPLVENLQAHWYKVLELNPDLAKKIRFIESDLYRIDEQECIDQIGDVLDSYLSFVEMLNNKLNPDEITYTRYKKAVDQLLLKFLDNMRIIVVLWDGIGQSADEEYDSKRSFTSSLVIKQLAKIEEIKKLNLEAINKIRYSILEWSKVDFNARKDAFEQVLSELNVLNSMIRKYGE